MSKGIWIVVEQRNAQIRKVSLELLSQARLIANETGDPLVAVVLGQNIQDLAQEVTSYGADKVILVDNEIS